MKTLTHALMGFLLLCFTASGLAACGGDGKSDKDKELEELRQLAEMDRREMENQYAEFAAQYGEMKKDIRDDSLVARLDAEQKRAEELLKELKELKSNSSAEILRLKKELATVRAVLRDYVRQVDSLQRMNEALTTERDNALAVAERTRRENNAVNERNTQLSEKVAVAAQLNATGVSVLAVKKSGKDAKRAKDITRFVVNFTLTRNVTAQTGNRKVYVRLLKPNQQVLASAGSFAYEDRSIEYSAVKTIEYTGEEQRITMYVNAGADFLEPGDFTAYIFVDGQMVGSGRTTISKK